MDTQQLPPAALGYADAAKYVGVSDSTLRREVDAGHLPVAYVRGRAVFLRQDLDEYLRHHRQTGAEGATNG